VYLYEPKGHVLRKILSEDIRLKIPNQDGFRSAAMIVLYVINKDRVLSGRTEWADLEIGCMGQSLFLEAVALGLGCCTIGAFFDDEVNEILNVDGTEETAVYMGAAGKCV
jgi:nitroreductase